MARKVGYDAYECPKCTRIKSVDEFYVTAKGKVSGWCKRCTKVEKRNTTLAIVYKSPVRPALNRWNRRFRDKIHDEASHRRVVVLDMIGGRVYEWPKFRKNQGRLLELWFAEVNNGIEPEYIENNGSGYHIKKEQQDVPEVS